MGNRGLLQFHGSSIKVFDLLKRIPTCVEWSIVTKKQ